MEDKKSNLAFSADLTKTQELIQVMMEGRENVISRNGNGRRMMEIEAEREEEGETDWEWEEDEGDRGKEGRGGRDRLGRV